MTTPQQAMLMASGPGLFCIQENFAAGLGNYALRSGTFAPFSIVATPYGSGIQVLGTASYNISSIGADLPLGSIRRMRFYFQLTLTGNDDNGYIWIGNASQPTALLFYPRREQFFESLGRAVFYSVITGASNPIGAAALALNTWYFCEILASNVNSTCTVTRVSDGVVIGTATHAGNHSSIKAEKLYFGRDGTFPCGTSQYAGLEICSAGAGITTAAPISGNALTLTQGTFASVTQSGHTPSFAQKGARLTLNDISGPLDRVGSSVTSVKLSGGRLQLVQGTVAKQGFQDPTRWSGTLTPRFLADATGKRLTLETNGSLSSPSFAPGVNWAEPVQTGLGSYFEAKFEYEDVLYNACSLPNNVFGSLSSAQWIESGGFGSAVKITIRPGVLHPNYGLPGYESIIYYQPEFIPRGS